MVVIFDPFACAARMVHALTALPSISTVHAPHCPVSQPTCVPVSVRLLRMKSTSSVRGSTSAVTTLPLTVNNRETDTGILHRLNAAATFYHRGTGVSEGRHAKDTPRRTRRQ